jgi:DNA-binding beta-propeller fold protein YncE
VTVQIQGSNSPLVLTRETTVTVTAPHPAQPVVVSYTGELQSDGSLLLKWTTQPDHVTVTLDPAINPQILQGSGQFSVAKPPLPLLQNDLYALTATLGEKSDKRVFTTCQKFGVLRPAIGVGSQPTSVAVSPDSSHVFVTNGDNNVSVIEVNLNDNPPFQVLPTPLGTGKGASGIAVSPTNSKFGKYVFVANQDNSVTVFAGTPPFQVVSAAVPAGNLPRCLAVSPDGRYVFVPINFSWEIGVVVIDTASAPSFTVVQGPAFSSKSITGISALAVSPDGNYLFASDVENSLLCVFQVQEGATPPYKVLSPALGVGQSPWGVAVSPDGHYAFTVNVLDNSVSVVDVSKGPPFQVLSPPVAAGSSPSALTVSPDGRFLFVSNLNTNRVSVLTIDKNNHPPVQPLQTLSVGAGPGGIAASPDGRFIFVANNSDNTVSVIEAVAVSI